MTSRTRKSFWTAYTGLPREVRKLAKETYKTFRHNPYHPALHFKRVSRTRPVYSVRIGLGYRALGLKVDDQEIVWFWIGTHADYDKLIN